MHQGNEFTLFDVLGFADPDPSLVVQETLGWILSPEARFAEVFYRRLFELAPQVKSLFRGNMEKQGQMLGHMIEGVVYASSRPENLVLGLQSLGRQHASYGVSREHYAFVRRALLDTIQDVLGRQVCARCGEGLGGNHRLYSSPHVRRKGDAGGMSSQARTSVRAAGSLDRQMRERSGDPCIMVIFGASGDLTKRLLLPSHLQPGLRQTAAGNDWPSWGLRWMSIRPNPFEIR